MIKNNSSKNTAVPTYKPKGVPTEISCEVGITLEIDKRWHKLTFSQKNKLPDGEKLNMVAECDAIWGDAKEEIQEQLKQLCKILGIKYEPIL